MIDTLTSLAFSIFENKGVYCLLIGSGVSRPSEIPTGWEITLDLVRRIAALRGVSGEPDWATWYKETFGSEPKYSELLDLLASTPDERRSILHSYIEPSAEDLAEGRKKPTRAHHAIAQLVLAGYVRVIVTTNFDRLIENALRDNGVEPTVISSDDALKGAVPLTHSRCFLVKIHGDYLDTRIRNTDTELCAYTPDLNALLDRIIDEHGLIVCGWSGDWDPALRAAITRAPSRRYPMYWTTRGPLSPIAQTLVAHRAGKVITIDSADAFFDRLEALIAAQNESQRPNPRSIELLVASAKKFLARPEYRIQLDELIGTELSQIEQSVPTDSAELMGQWSNERFVTAVSRYEARVEALTRIFGVIGRYGAGDDFAGATEAIIRLGYRESVGGLSVLLGLRTYPAVLLLYGYGVGLLKAGRYTELFKLFSSHVRTGRDDTKTVVTRLFLGAWDGMEQDPWRLLPGLNDRKTALSDHLHSLFEEWTADYVFTKAEFTELFEHFELLASLAFITQSADKASLQSTVQTPGRDFVWTPMGRAVWDGKTRRIILDDWGKDLAEPLLKAGFAHGDPEFLRQAIVSLDRMSGRWR